MRFLQPNTRYTITVDPAVADRFGQRMPGPHVVEFGTGDGTPGLDIETGAWVVEATRPGYPAWSRNLTSIEADITVVPETKLGALAGQLDWWDQDVLDVKKVGLKTKRVDHANQGTEESVGPDPNRARQAAGQRVAARRLLLRRPPGPGRAAPGRDGTAAARDAAQLHEPGRDREAVGTVRSGVGDPAVGRGPRSPAPT